jgi:hypothetical protein
MVDQRVRERHAGRPRADDQVVRLQDRHHGIMLSAPEQRVNCPIGQEPRGASDQDRPVITGERP